VSVSGEKVDRYDISVNKFSLLSPLGDNATVSIDILHETLSGASPWFNSSGVNNTPVATMSGASIAETRDEKAASVSLYKGLNTHSFGFVSSQENDYSAQAYNYDFARDFNQKNTTLSTGLSWSNDRIFPNQSLPLHQNIADGIDTAKKRSQSAYIGISQNINIRTIAKFGVSFTTLSGYLSDPYKLYDRRPDSRSQTVVSTGLRYFSSEQQTAYHLDYRYYQDDWELTSDTFSFKAYINLINNWQIAPGLRYYSQRGASFYSAYQPAGGIPAGVNYSEDYRLSYYGSISYQLDIYKQFSDLRLKMSLERYQSDIEYSQSNGLYQSPGLVNFTMFSIGFDYYF